MYELIASNKIRNCMTNFHIIDSGQTLSEGAFQAETLIPGLSLELHDHEHHQPHDVSLFHFANGNFKLNFSSTAVTLKRNLDPFCSLLNA